MKALEGKDKMAITSAVRCEIVTSIATLVMVHTIYPTPEPFQNVLLLNIPFSLIVMDVVM